MFVFHKNYVSQRKNKSNGLREKDILDQDTSLDSHIKL